MRERPSHDLDRLTVAEAAEALGVSQDAVRKRIARRTISHDRDESGRVYVYLAPSETVHKTDQDTAQDAASKTVQDAYVQSLEDQVRFLREELERKDAILLNLTERIPQLEAPTETPGGPETVEEEQEGAEPQEPLDTDSSSIYHIRREEANARYTHDKYYPNLQIALGLVGTIIAALAGIIGAFISSSEGSTSSTFESIASAFASIGSSLTGDQVFTILSALIGVAGTIAAAYLTVRLTRERRSQQ